MINPNNGMVDMSKIFDTCTTSQILEAFIEELQEFIVKDYIICAACHDECTKNMSQKVKDWFISMGSLEINNLEYR